MVFSKKNQLEKQHIFYESTFIRVWRVAFIYKFYKITITISFGSHITHLFRCQERFKILFIIIASSTDRLFLIQTDRLGQIHKLSTQSGGCSWHKWTPHSMQLCFTAFVNEYVFLNLIGLPLNRKRPPCVVDQSTALLELIHTCWDVH